MGHLNTKFQYIAYKNLILIVTRIFTTCFPHKDTQAFHLNKRTFSYIRVRRVNFLLGGIPILHTIIGLG